MFTHYREESALVAETLDFLADAVNSPEVIDNEFEADKVPAGAVIMTSMGHAKSAMLTPFYFGLQYDPSFNNRWFRATAEERPLSEALLRVRQDQRLQKSAALTLRLCLPQKPDEVRETTWVYPIRTDNHATTWDIIKAIQNEAEAGEPTNARTGIVRVTPERLDAGTWAISEQHDPALSAIEFHHIVTGGVIKFAKLV